MKLEMIEKLIQLVERSSLEEFSFEKEDKEGKLSLKLSKAARLVQGSAPVSVAVSGTGAPSGAASESAGEPDPQNLITSPLVGTFYASPDPTSEAFVKIGARVNAGDVLCIIEAMKVMNKVKADRGGVIRRILVNNADPVQYGQPLFELE